ncbi:Gfo/Idh/MocA family protein [Streptomyces sp. NPDC059679]|uniref:Gfo/Idh/MocA family protein n=1 Tax=Streptomyces sp. NPDC059679 TaxID=3346903 RepID=UPI00367CD1B9
MMWYKGSPELVSGAVTDGVPAAVPVAQPAVESKPRGRPAHIVSEHIRLGVIGCGRISQAAHLPAIAKAENVELKAVCDASTTLANTMALRYGASAFYTANDLLGAPVDAVLIAVPDRFHAAVARQALQAGKHVIVEKPIATTVTESQELRDLARSAGLELQVANMKRFDPGVQYAAEAVAKIGPLRSVVGWCRVMSQLRAPIEATFFPPLVVDATAQAQELEYKAAHRAEHLLATHGIHTVDLLRYLAGDYAIHGAVLSHNERDYSWHALGRFPDGAALSLEVTASVHAEWSEGFDLYGDAGHIRLRCPFPFTRQPSSVRVFTEANQAYAEPVFGDSDPYERQIEAFARGVLLGKTTVPTADDGIEALKVIDAIRDAASRQAAHG